MAKKKRLPLKLQPWVEARRRHRLSHAHIQMARELGMNPRKLDKLDNHDQEPWKAPLPVFIEDLYFRQFGRERPDVVCSIEEISRLQEAKKQQRREAKAARESSASATDDSGAQKHPSAPNQAASEGRGSSVAWLPPLSRL